MKNKTIVLVFVILVAYGLLIFAAFSWVKQPVAIPQSTQYPQRSATWKGLFEDGFESMAFRACGNDEWWWTDGDLQEIYDVIAPDGMLSDETTIVYVELIGRISPEGAFGHLNSYPRQINIQQILAVETTIPLDCH